VNSKEEVGIVICGVGIYIFAKAKVLKDYIGNLI